MNLQVVMILIIVVYARSVCGMMELATLKCILLKDCLNFVVVNDFS